MNLSTLKDQIVALKERLEKMFEDGAHGVSTIVGEMVGELHTLVNDLHGIVEKMEGRLSSVEKHVTGTAPADPVESDLASGAALAAAVSRISDLEARLEGVNFARAPLTGTAGALAGALAGGGDVERPDVSASIAETSAIGSGAIGGTERSPDNAGSVGSGG